MTTLTDFLLARIAEDEAVARASLEDDDGRSGWYTPREPRVDEGHWHVDSDMAGCRVEGIGITIYDEGGHTPDQAAHIARHDPARVLAECEAKRRIVEMHEAVTRGDGPVRSNSALEGQIRAYGRTLAFLALPYADHADYRDEWRP